MSTIRKTPSTASALLSAFSLITPSFVQPVNPGFDPVQVAALLALRHAAEVAEAAHETLAASGAPAMTPKLRKTTSCPLPAPPALWNEVETTAKAAKTSSLAPCMVVGRNDPPKEFICPITLSVMDSPVIAADGFSYEQEAITKWFKVRDPFPHLRSRRPSPPMS